MKKKFKDLSSEFKFNTSRSSGSGGQHVNKTETKVELLFDVENSNILSGIEKETIKSKSGSFINRENVIRISSQKYRSQQRNKEDVINKFYNLMQNIFKEKKKRKKTIPPESMREGRLKEKRIRAEKKELRKRLF